MPQLGETVSEGKILAWYKAVGDSVVAGDNLFEMETEKVSMEVPATSAGVLTEIRVGVDESAPVGAVVAIISDVVSPAARPRAPGAAAPSEPPRTASSAPLGGPSPSAARPQFAPSLAVRPRFTRKLEPFREVLTPERNYGPARSGSGVETTPLARRIAAEIGIDLLGVQGSGPRGRILGKDVEALRAARLHAQPRAPAIAGSLSAAQVKALYESGSYVEEPLDAMRRVIARRMTESQQTVPHFYLTVDLQIDTLSRLREEINSGVSQARGKPVCRLSISDFLIKSWAAALQQVSAANAVWAQDRILRFTHSDIGVAVAVERGLFTPVIRRVNAKTLEQISIEVKDLTFRARTRKLKADELQGGASSISNLGMYGVREFTAIINPPQSTILAVGAIERRAVEAPGGGVRFASLVTVTLSCDHRVVDGTLGAEVLEALRELIRRPADTLLAR